MSRTGSYLTAIKRDLCVLEISLRPQSLSPRVPEGVLDVPVPILFTALTSTCLSLMIVLIPAKFLWLLLCLATLYCLSSVGMQARSKYLLCGTCWVLECVTVFVVLNDTAVTKEFCPLNSFPPFFFLLFYEVVANSVVLLEQLPVVPFSMA